MKWKKFAIYDWKIDLETQNLECGAELSNLLFGKNWVNEASSLFELVPKSQRAMVKRAFKRALESGESQTVRCSLITDQALFTYMQITIEKESGHRLYGTISPRLVIPNKQDLGDIFYSIFDSNVYGLIIADAETRILACNKSYESLTGYKLDNIAGLSTRIFNADKHDQAYYENLWGELNQNGVWSGTIISRHADGSTFPQDLTIQKVQPSHGDAFYLGLSSDLSGKLERIDDVESGGIDLLTQLPNKNNFAARVGKACAEIQQGQGVVVLAIQPELSDSHSSELKRQFASYLKDNSLSLCCGYIGQGCFTVCLPFDYQRNQQIVARIGQTITKFFHSFKHAQTSVAIALKNGLTGVSVYNADATSPSQLISHSYQAVLEVHSGHERRINFYDREIHNHLERKKKLEQHVLETLEKEAIEVYFQPIVDLKNKRIDKFEALCRFPSNDQFDASTFELIGIVEELNKVVELDDLVLILAIKQLPELRGLFGEHVKLSVNRSVNTSTDLVHLLERAAMILDSQKIDPAAITLEFTESAYFESNKENREILSLLREAGVKIAVDDFGTGSTSFRYLKECYFDIIKIDRSFVKHLVQPSRQYDVVQSLVQLAVKLGLEVIVEGVETEEELSVVRQIGVNYIQGYYFSKPMPLEALKEVNDYCHVEHEESNSTKGTLADVVQPVRHIDPGDPLSLIFQYFKESHYDALPVVENKICVGFIDRLSMNLHLTPTMGTDLESNKENNYWHKPASRVMQPISSKLHCHMPQSEIPKLLAEELMFPWCLVDDNGEFKGLVTQKSVLNNMVNNISVS